MIRYFSSTAPFRRHSTGSVHVMALIFISDVKICIKLSHSWAVQALLVPWKRGPRIIYTARVVSWLPPALLLSWVAGRPAFVKPPTHPPSSVTHKTLIISWAWGVTWTCALSSSLTLVRFACIFYYISPLPLFRLFTWRNVGVPPAPPFS